MLICLPLNERNCLNVRIHQIFVSLAVISHISNLIFTQGFEGKEDTKTR